MVYLIIFIDLEKCIRLHLKLHISNLETFLTFTDCIHETNE